MLARVTAPRGPQGACCVNSNSRCAVGTPLPEAMRGNAQPPRGAASASRALPAGSALS